MSALSQNPTLIGAILSKKISDLDTKNLQSQQKPQTDLLAGYNQKRRIQNAKINAEIAALQVEDLKNALLSALEKTYVTYENSMNLIQLETENYTIAKQNIDIAFDRFKVGIATSYELREVQRNAVAAETRLIEAKYAAKTAEIELIRLSGNLL